MDEATDNWKNCIMESDADEDAYDVCTANFKMASRKCPCNSECSTGCPCDGGYECQEFVMAMCQMSGSSTNRVNYTYVISADGHHKDPIKRLKIRKKNMNFSPCKFFFWSFSKENRHYLSPQSSGPPSYYPFLYYAGFALLNGEVFIFGGSHDD